MNLGRVAGDDHLAAPQCAFSMRRLADYAALTKARLASLVLFTTLVGYVLGAEGTLDWPRLTCTLLGTGLTALAANVFNQWMEIRLDARMRRTRNRPLPAGSLSPRHAFALASAMMFLGLVLLVWIVNLISAVLAAVTIIIYLAAYTPLKTRTSLCTLVGAICGAIPPMIGWTAATGRLDGGAWVLGCTLLVWQIPHFLALAWLYRDDYAHAGFRMLPLFDRSGETTAMLAILYSLALLPITISATLIGLAGWLYMAAAAILGAGMVALAIQFRHQRTHPRARRLFLATIAYLPLLLGIMLADRGPCTTLVRAAGLSQEHRAAVPKPAQPRDAS